MTLQAMILLALKASIVLTVFAVGLTATVREATWLLRRPGKLLRSLAAMDVVMPLLVWAIIAAVPLLPAVRVALVALAVSPVPPLLPGKARKFAGTGPYVVSLLVVAAVAAIVFIPVAIEFGGWVREVDTGVPVAKIAGTVFITVIAPLAAGIVLHALAPALAKRAARSVSQFASALLLASAVPVIIESWPLMMSLVGNDTLAVFAGFTLVGLAVGHLLGGPEPGDRTVLAFATASRHPGIAIALAAANFSQARLTTAAVILYLLVNLVLTIPYAKWRKRAHVLRAGDDAPEDMPEPPIPLSARRNLK